MAHKDKVTKAYSDLTGKFPIQSSRGNNYVMVAYHPDSNAILVTALKNRNAQSIVEAWQSLYNRFRKGGATITLWILDNECSSDLKRAFINEDMTWQRVPPHQHRANDTEREI